MRNAFFFTATIFLSLVPAATELALAGDGDVDYSAPYITLDPETGELITVNPESQQKSHTDPRSEGSTRASTGRAVATSNSEPGEAGSLNTDGNTASGIGPALLGGLGAVFLLSIVAFIFRGQRGTGDA